MTDLTWILDVVTGGLVAEGLTVEEASALADDLLPVGYEINCARPLDTHLHFTPSADEPYPAELRSQVYASSLTLRIARIYHDSVVDGPGRRSVVQFQGCPIRCPGCYVPHTHDPRGGVARAIEDVVAELLVPVGAPRDGITILGGEPFSQPMGLLALLRHLKARRIHTVVYTGYTVEALTLRADPEIHEALPLIDLLIDGPFIASLADNAGEWRGSRNQRLISNPGCAVPRSRSRC